jgi:DnaK suppressor protein
MNATVTKNTKKSTPKATATARAKSAGKTAAKAPVKAKAATAKKTPKPAVKTAKKTAVAVKKTAAKTSTKLKTARVVKTAVKAKPPKSAQPTSKAGSKKAAPKTAATARKTVTVAAKPNKDVSRPKAAVTPSKTVARPMDEIEPSAVPKVRKVAIKNSKSTQTGNTDGTLLSEAQILKMSEKDYMNQAQLDFFKHRLQQLEKDLLKNADETTEHLRETVLVPDPADRATIEEEHALELRTRDRERKLLKKVQQSIASIDTGEYGWCEETGEPIGVPRLLARPTATLSLEAQQRRELKQKLYGD